MRELELVTGWDDEGPAFFVQASTAGERDAHLFAITTDRAEAVRKITELSEALPLPIRTAEIITMERRR